MRSVGVSVQHCVAAKRVHESLCRAVLQEQLGKALTANNAAPGALLFGVSIHKDVACDDALCLASCSITAFMQGRWETLPVVVASSMPGEANQGRLTSNHIHPAMHAQHKVS